MRALKVMIVDDDRLVRRSLGRFVLSQNAEPVEAGSVLEALALPLDADAWIIDVKLPDGLGIELLRTLRERGVRAPALVITGEATVDLARAAARLGASFCAKPFDMAAVTALLEAARYRDMRRAPIDDDEALVGYLAGVLDLSDGEREIIVARLDGVLTVEGMAASLEISVAGVKWRRGSILRKAETQGFVAESLDAFLIDVYRRHLLS